MANVWKIGWRDGEKDPWHVIEPSPGMYEADPFVIDGWMFYELYDYKKGVIAARPWPDGTPTIVLEEDHHLSFPAIEKIDDSYVMTPETGAGPIKIYKARRFPDKWEQVGEIPGTFGDTISYGGNLLITTEANDNMLTIFKAVDGGFEYVLQDERPNSRNAGNVFELNGKLVRPCQLTEGGYGAGIVLKTFDPDTFEEEEIKRFTPVDERATGMHTFNSHYNHSVIDLRYAA